MVNCSEFEGFKAQEDTREVELWFRNNGDMTHRLDYNMLNENSIVFDLGGYKGQFASDIFSKYCSNIYIFEPAHEFYESIVKRYKYNDKIKVFNFGLADKDIEVNMALENDGSSIYIEKPLSEKHDQVKLVEAEKFFTDNNIKHIDLMKINIEGGEYDLLDHLLDTNFVENIENIQPKLQ